MPYHITLTSQGEHLRSSVPGYPLSQVFNRSSLSQKIAEIIARKQVACLVGLEGIYGSGKTVLAVEFAAAGLAIGNYDWILWIQGDPFEQYIPSFEEIKTEHLDSLADLTTGRLLIVFDRFVISSNYENISTYKADILVTCMGELPEIPSPFTPIVVGGFSVDDSLKFVQSRLPIKTLSPEDQDILRDIVTSLNGMPDALEILARYLVTNGISNDILKNILFHMTYLQQLANPFYKATSETKVSHAAFTIAHTLIGVRNDPVVRWISPTFGGILALNNSQYMIDPLRLATSVPSSIGVYVTGHSEVGIQGRFLEETTQSVTLATLPVLVEWARHYNELVTICLLPLAQIVVTQNALQTTMKDYIIQWNEIAVEVANERNALIPMLQNLTLIALAQQDDFDLTRFVAIQDALPKNNAVRALTNAKIAQIHLQRHELKQAYAIYSIAKDEAESVGEYALSGAITLTLAKLRFSAGNLEEALELGLKALTSFIVANMDLEVVESHVLLGNIEYVLREYRAAAYHYDKAYNLLQPLVALEVSSKNIEQLHQMIIRQPRLNFVNDWLQEFARMSGWLRTLTIYASVLRHLGEVIGFRGETEAAVQLLEGAISIFESSGHLLELANTYLALGGLYEHIDVDESSKAYQKAREIYTEIASVVGVATVDVAFVRLAKRYKWLDIEQYQQRAEQMATDIGSQGLTNYLKSLEEKINKK